jgi:hypothetical protein
VLALHDPTFPDMYEWLTLSTKNDGQHYPQSHGSTPITKTLDDSDVLLDITVVEEADDDVLETVRTPLKRTPSPSTSLSMQDPSNDNGQHYPPTSPSPTAAEVSNTLPDIAAVAKMDINSDTLATTKPKRPPSPNLSPQDSSKRLRPSTTIEESDEDMINSPIKQTPRTAKPTHASADQNNKLGPVGISRSAIGSQKLKAKMRAGTYTINKARQKTFEIECRLSDPHTKFCYGENWKVFHSRCGKWLTMNEAYNSTRFRQHIKRCKKMVSGSKFMTLNSFVTKEPAKQKNGKITVNASKSDVTPQTAEYPCLGITESHDQRVSRFITQTGADGGGARSVTKIANELFNKTYGELSERKKSQVDAAQMHEWSFRFDHLRMAIHSLKCNRFVSA